MASRISRLTSVVFLILLAIIDLSAALKFDLQSYSANQQTKSERCVRNFVARDTLVVVTAIVDGQKGDGQIVDMHIKDAVGNDYGRPKDIVGEKRMAFTSHADAAFDVCFTNILKDGHAGKDASRHIELDIDIGADARDWSAIQAAEKLKPVETELRRIEELVSEVVSEMEYLRTREQKLRDTNESTNERVKWFAFGTMGIRSIHTSAPRPLASEGEHSTTPEWRDKQISKPLNPHMTNTNSTIANEMPSVGADKAPPELITSVEPDFVPKDSVPENTERMTGDTQKGSPDEGANADLGVGEMKGADFRVEPIRRTGEDANTMRARLNYQSRKRGTLESDLLLSTFADAHLAGMSPAQLQQYDLFLDENDWDIYYWATQEPSPTSRETAEGAGPDAATSNAQGTPIASSKTPGSGGSSSAPETDDWRQGQPRSGEWAQTVGTFKPAYRPVPQRWKNSEVLSMLRKHVIDRSAGGVHEEKGEAGVGGDALAQGVKGTGGGGLGSMPAVKNYDT
ncbi:MAG: succinate dehydrogenase assembly factor 2 [Sclerophora amabilis]|nr:MAG: succinate dehydrogenase assembly factor 2 [Sclerophora amabilis]